MKKIIVFLALISASAVAVFAQADRLGTRQWKLVQLNGARVVDASRAYLELNTAHTRFTGHTGCNRMSGTVDIRGRRIDFSNVSTTKMACVEPRARRVETGFVRALENVDRFRQTGNSLELLDRNRVVARLTAMTKQMPDDGGDQRVDLEDRKWMLEAIKGVAVSKAGRTAFIVFDKNKGSAGGNTSCNVFGGSYTSTGRTLQITEIISTMRACVEDDRMSIEREFLDGLRQANRYEIERGKLMLYRNQRLLLTFDGLRK
jgi:heat shock protein HslJ